MDETAFVHVELNGDEGALIVGEFGLIDDERKAGLGLWGYTGDFPDAVDSGIERAGAFGAYVLWESVISLDGDRPSAAIHARAGYADARVHPVQFAWAGGIVRWTERGDRYGFGIASAWLSDRYHAEVGGSAVTGGRSETALEGTAAFVLTDWLTVQPDVQYVFFPGIETDRSDALVVSTRIQIAF
jgi:porin